MEVSIVGATKSIVELVLDKVVKKIVNVVKFAWDRNIGRNIHVARSSPSLFLRMVLLLGPCFPWNYVIPR
jgi:hypothetical protein